jgi:hypothetical protein
MEEFIGGLNVLGNSTEAICIENAGQVVPLVRRTWQDRVGGVLVGPFPSDLASEGGRNVGLA